MYEKSTERPTFDQIVHDVRMDNGCLNYYVWGNRIPLFEK